MLIYKRRGPGRRALSMTNFKIKRVSDRILAQPVEKKEQAGGSVIVQQRAQEKSRVAKVVVSRNAKKGGSAKVSTSAPRDTGMMGASVDVQEKVEAQKFTLVREDDILGIPA